MLIYFNKYHGAGNDFIIIDNRRNLPGIDDERLVKVLCDRHFGIGADGLILIGNAKGFDFRMDYFNSDGRPGTMCGNGGRCAAAFAARHHICGSESRFLAADGEHRAKMVDDGMVELSMGDVAAPGDILGNSFLDTGSPHYIIPVSDINGIDVVSRGRVIRNTSQFSPEGTNVNFVQQRGDEVLIRTYERGVEDETLACGTGVTAAAIASRWEHRPGKFRVPVTARGGKLEVRFELSDEGACNVTLCGPARFVFSGETDTASYNLNNQL